MLKKSVFDRIMFKNLIINDTVKSDVVLLQTAGVDLNNQYILKYIAKLIHYTVDNVYDRVMVYNSMPKNEKYKNSLAVYVKLYGEGVGTMLYNLRSENLSKKQKQSYIKSPRPRRFSPFTTKKWLDLGYSTKDAEQKVRDVKCKAQVKSAFTHNNNDNILPTQKGYWIKKGYNEEEAKQKVHERQQTFSKEKCIEKYGEIEGLKKFNERQEKWQNTLNSKSDEEKKDINRRKLNTVVSSYENEIAKILDCNQ